MSFAKRRSEKFEGKKSRTCYAKTTKFIKWDVVRNTFMSATTTTVNKEKKSMLKDSSDIAQ